MNRVITTTVRVAAILAMCALTFAGDSLPVINVYPSVLTINEPYGSGAFLLLRDGPGEVTVRFEIVGSAIEGKDYGLSIPSSTSVTIAASPNIATVGVTALDDLDIEDDETIVLRILPDPTYTIGDAS